MNEEIKEMIDHATDEALRLAAESGLSGEDVLEMVRFALEEQA